jgi:Tol biopolymer transport system component
MQKIPQALIRFEQTDYKILFTAVENGSYGLFVVESNGNNLKKIRDFQEYIGAAWTPDGRRIIYLKGGGSSRQLFVMDSSGINEQKIADSVETFAVSPDGNRLCYIYYNSYWEVFLCNIDGSNKTKLTNTQMQKFGLHWSPVNPEIVFTENDNVTGKYENIYRIQVDSGILDTLATGYEIPQVSDWSKDGNFILFGTVYSDLYKINLMSKQITKLAYSRSASFSPDGQKILFQSGFQVYMMNADGSNQHQVSKYPNPYVPA